MAKKDFTGTLTTTMKTERQSADQRFGKDLHDRFAKAAMAFGTDAPPAAKHAPEKETTPKTTAETLTEKASPVTASVTVSGAKESVAPPRMEPPQEAARPTPVDEKRTDKPKERHGFLGAPGTFVESVSVCREDSDRIEEYRVRLARQRTFATKAEIFRAGLLALNALGDEEVMKLIKEASRFRPTKKERKRAN